MAGSTRHEEDDSYPGLFEPLEGEQLRQTPFCAYVDIVSPSAPDLSVRTLQLSSTRSAIEACKPAASPMRNAPEFPPELRWGTRSTPFGRIRERRSVSMIRVKLQTRKPSGVAEGCRVAMTKNRSTLELGVVEYRLWRVRGREHLRVVNYLLPLWPMFTLTRVSNVPARACWTIAEPRSRYTGCLLRHCRVFVLLLYQSHARVVFSIHLPDNLLV
jgi:hypothetical protein